MSSFEKPLLGLGKLVAADYSAKQYYAMKLNGSGAWVLPSTAGERWDGLLQNKPDGTTKIGSVMTHGISKAICGTAWSEGDSLTVDANGKLAPTTNVGQWVGAKALDDATASDIQEVQLGMGYPQPGMYLAHAIDLANIADGDMVTTFTPGFDGRIVGAHFITDVVASTASKLSTLNFEIGTTNVTGGTIALTTAACDTIGKVVDAAAITAANAFGPTDTISVEASSTTTFGEGAGTLVVKLLIDQI